MQGKLATWATAEPERRFTRLLRLIAHREWLRAAAEKVLSSPGAKTPGVDGVTREHLLDVLDSFLTELREALLSGHYEPLPVRRIYIPKANGKQRPLGIPCLRDRIVQRAMVMAMEPIWESDFHRCSYGFRPGRSVHQAIQAVSINLTDTHGPGLRTKGRWVIEGDLSSYFDTVHHKRLVRCVKRRIRDTRFIALLWRFLKAGHVDKRVFRTSTEGVPQGGIVSPLLSNIMLHEFDRFIEAQYTGKKARNHRRGWNASVRLGTPIACREQRRLIPAVCYVRYADDFVLIVKGTRADAQSIKDRCRRFLDEELRLTLNIEKTCVTHVNDGFVFLGHRIVRKRSGRGHMRPVTGIPHENIRRLTFKITQLLSSNYDKDAHQMIMKINQLIRGWTAFYRHTMYSSRIYGKLDTVVFWKLGHWLARKYRTRVNKLMRKWYRFSTVHRLRTWMVSTTVEGQRFSTTLLKFSRAIKVRLVPPCPRANPYIGLVMTAGGGNFSYSHVAFLSDTEMESRMR